jgi:hypothetical protein
MLAKLSFNAKITSLIPSYFTNRVMSYVWGAACLQPFPLTDGLPQGNPLSPIFCNLYVALMLKKEVPFSYNSLTNTLSFIDDYAPFAASLSI